MQDSDKTQNSYSQRIAEKLKNIYGARMQSSEKMNPETMAEEQTAGDNTEWSEESNNVQALREQLAKVETERNEFRDHAMRKVAELENFRRRTQQEKEDLTAYANQKLLQNILPIVDDLQRALELGRKGNDYKALLEGIEMVYNKAVQTLGEAGVTPIEPVGQEFDVNLHEALMRMPSEAPEGQVVQEIQRGYMYKDKVLRHAKVITSAGQEQG